MNNNDDSEILTKSVYSVVLFIAFMGGVIGFLIGKYWKKM